MFQVPSELRSIDQVAIPNLSPCYTYQLQSAQTQLKWQLPTVTCNWTTIALKWAQPKLGTGEPWHPIPCKRQDTLWGRHICCMSRCYETKWIPCCCTEKNHCYKVRIANSYNMFPKSEHASLTQMQTVKWAHLPLGNFWVTVLTFTSDNRCNWHSWALNELMVQHVDIDTKLLTCLAHFV